MCFLLFTFLDLVLKGEKYPDLAFYKLYKDAIDSKKLYFKCGFKDYRNNFLKVRLLKGLKNHITCKRKEANVKYKYQTLSLTL